MSNCHGCGAAIKFKYRHGRGTYSEELDENNQPMYVAGPVMQHADGTDMIEDLCDRCIEASKVNREAGFYDGLWNDKHCHPSHVVEAKPSSYLV